MRGVGLLLALALGDNVSGALVNECRDRGLLVNPVRPDALRLIPPLIVSDEEADKAIDIIDAALGAVAKG